MAKPKLMRNFWAEKRVLVTGHTGFKGAWLSHWLLQLGADVVGFALPPDGTPNLYDLLGLGDRMDSRFGDLRQVPTLRQIVRDTQPEIVLHLAAQALVRPSYDAPLDTFETNVMGTANLLEILRTIHAPSVCIVATTDKVYRNLEQGVPFKEDAPLGGHDPYSASKAATELVISSYRQSFFKEAATKLISVRAGNAIGGGDWSIDRIIPDAVRAWTQDEPLEVRRPNAVRPWQHVLEPLFGYLYLCEHAAQAQHASYNIAPETSDKMQVGALVNEARVAFGRGELRLNNADEGPHEAGILQLDARRIAEEFGVRPTWTSADALHRTMKWYKAFYAGERAETLCNQDIDAFEEAR
ncbi:CDP-glucose 4,6-dehydratase [Maritalea mediterranea]|uniref:CDP-glucose 4,6-dehydratase n=1 Tax=Maritalea mediterranea TaxID=2909667 RepID=A0ABS9E4H5_9HYPH|nr:CDP-glucose 4,6-dehydratase [Maritalea mediterranea]MCF4097693.1 CDP-glucose 4,6-dehydratase [Maritalea mediterranea]